MPPDRLYLSGRAQPGPRTKLWVFGLLAEAGTDARAAEQGLQASKQILRGLEASVQELTSHRTLSSLHLLFSGAAVVPFSPRVP